MQGITDALPTWLNDPMLWGVTPWRLIAAAAMVFLGFLSRSLIRHVFASYLTRFAERTKAKWDDDVVRLTPKPLSYTIQILIWYIAALLLSLPKEPVDLRAFVYQGLEVALGITICWVFFAIIEAFTLFLGRVSSKTESRLDDQIVPLLRKTLKVVAAVTFGVMIIQNMGYSVTSLIASLGVGGLALALAARDTVANLFGSVVVFTDQPFQVGDWIEVSGIEGTVEEVGFRTTRVRRFDKSLVTLPNQTFSTSPITNHSGRPIRRITMNVGLTYETKPTQLKSLLDELRSLLASHEGIDQGFHFVHFTEFGDCSLNLQIYCFTESTVWTEFLSVRESLMLRIMQSVDSHGLEMAFPTRTVYLRDEGWPQRGTAVPAP